MLSELSGSKMKSKLLISILCFCSISVTGQNTPAFRQFYFNPAFAGMNDYAEVTWLYRQQWVTFNNAPSVAGFTFQVPSQNRASFGMNFLTQEAVALRTTSTQATFAYRIPIAANQFLFFGLSGVVGYNDLNLNDADYSNDPTILNAASTKFYGDANFGLVYQLRGLRVGFALPKLFGQPYYSPMDLVNVRYSQLRNQVYSASYKFHKGNFSIEPYGLFRMNRDLQNWWEAATIVYFKDKIWTGASYHSTQGLGFFLGMDFKEKIRVGYSYEIPLSSSDFAKTSSHEVHLTLRMGKKRNFKWASKYEHEGKAEVASIAEDEITAPGSLDSVNSRNEKILKEPLLTDLPVMKLEETQRFESVTPIVKDVIVSTPPKQATLAAGFYVIAGSFIGLEYAIDYQKNLTAIGYSDVAVGMNAANKLFYVYLFSSYDVEEAIKVRDQLRLKKVTANVWILKVL